MIDLVPVTHKKNELRIAKPIKISTNKEDFTLHHIFHVEFLCRQPSQIILQFHLDSRVDSTPFHLHDTTNFRFLWTPPEGRRF